MALSWHFHGVPHGTFMRLLWIVARNGLLPEMDYCQKWIMDYCQMDYCQKLMSSPVVGRPLGGMRWWAIAPNGFPSPEYLRWLMLQKS